MTDTNNPIYFIPLPHILLASTITTIVTILAVFQGYQFFILSGYIIAFAIFCITKQFARCIALLICAMFSIQIFFKIQQINNSYKQHHEFLRTPTIVQATILQKQINQLDKDQASLILQTSNMYNSVAGSLSNPIKIIVFLPAKRALNFYEGQIIKIFKLKLQQPADDCSYASYMIKEGIWATAYITNENIRIINYKNKSWLHTCSTRFSSLLHPSTIDLFNPLFLGKREKTLNTITIQHQSLYWGIAHHMARSGIHLVTLFGLFMTLFHCLRIQHFYRYIICAILALAYLHISIPSVSFVRALCMILFQIISKINNFQYSSLHALTLTTLIMVMHNPWYILFLDFQLSFSITAVIIWLFQAKWCKTIAFT